MTKEELQERFEFRNVKAEEADQAIEIENICFPPNEACSPKSMTERVSRAQETFWWQLIKRRERSQDF